MKHLGLLLGLCLVLCAGGRAQQIEHHLNLHLVSSQHVDWDLDQDLEVDDETSDNHSSVDLQLAYPTAPAGLTIVYFVCRVLPVDTALPLRRSPARPERPPTSQS